MLYRELGVGEKFRVGNNEYTKVDTRKISCCKSVNAENSNGGVWIDPDSEVEKVSSDQ